MVVAISEVSRQHPFKHLEFTFYAIKSTADSGGTILKNKVEFHTFAI